MFNGNKIYKIENGVKKRVFFIPGMSIKFKGKNSVAEIHYPLPELKRCRIKLGTNCKFTMESSDKWVRKLEVFVTGKNHEVCIGKNLSVTSGCEIHLGPEDNLKVEIGDNCMFGKKIMIRATDGHTIYDESTKELLNKGKNVKIGNHVWLSENVVVLKGAVIPDNCIVGINSMVTSSFPNDKAGVLAVGTPAKIVKEGVNWNRVPPSWYLEGKEL